MPDSELTPHQRAELATLAAMSDDEIDTTDIPEILEWRIQGEASSPVLPTGRPNKEARMMHTQNIEEVLERVRRLEVELHSIGVNVNVEVRGLDVDNHNYEAHEVESCVLCAAFAKGLEQGQRKGYREQTGRFEGTLNRLLDRA